MFGRSSRAKKQSSQTPANPVQFVNAGTPAIPAEELEAAGHVNLSKAAKATAVSFEKKGMTGARFRVVVLVDHSGSMYSDFENGGVQALLTRVLGYATQVDTDGEIEIIRFDSKVKTGYKANIGNHVQFAQSLWSPNDMGSTDLAGALRKVRDMAATTKEPMKVFVLTDGNPNDYDFRKKDAPETTEIVVDLARYPACIKFLALRDVPYLQKLDDMPGRMVDNVDAKFYRNLSSIGDDQFADDMTDEDDAWVAECLATGVLRA